MGGRGRTQHAQRNVNLLGGVLYYIDDLGKPFAMSGADAHGHVFPWVRGNELHEPRAPDGRRRMYTVLIIENDLDSSGLNARRTAAWLAGGIARTASGSFGLSAGDRVQYYVGGAAAAAAAAPAASAAAGGGTAAAPSSSQRHSAKHGSQPFVLPMHGTILGAYIYTGFSPPYFSERPQSFGLHSPDQLPKSESEFKAIASSFGLHSPDNVAPSEKLHPSYNPRLFCDGGLYLDPDIIGESLPSHYSAALP